MKVFKIIFILPLLFSISKNTYEGIIKDNTIKDSKAAGAGDRCAGCSGTARL